MDTKKGPSYRHGIQFHSTPIDTALRRVWIGIRDITSGAEQLLARCQAVHVELKPLDSAARHDVELSDQEMESVSLFPFQFPLIWAVRDLHQARQFLERALQAVAGVYRGEMRLKTEDRIVRQIETVKALEISLGELRDEEKLPRQPFHIRKVILSRLLLGFSSLVSSVSPLRRQVAAESVLFQDMLEPVVRNETELFALRAEVSRLRDNPSQPMAKKLSNCIEQMRQIYERSTSARAICMRLCRRNGMVFYNRAGMMTESATARHYPVKKST